MIIAIDGNEANIINRVGVNAYAYEILSSIKKLEGEWKNKYKVIVYLKRAPISDMPRESENFIYKIIPGGGAWIITKLLPTLIKEQIKPNVLFVPSHYIPPASPIPCVCTIHDLGYLEFSGQFTKYDFWQLKLWSAYSIFASKQIIAVSNSTKKDIVRHYGFASNKIDVIYEAYDKDKFNMDIPEKDVRRVKAKYHIVDDYILYLGTLKPSKNIEGLLEAFSKIITSFPKHKLIIAGKKGWLYDSIFQKVLDLKIEDKVIFTDYLDEKDKPALFKGAKLFVMPSFWEGFGLDPLYALACGVPVVVSNKGSLPEVVGDAGIGIDPHNIDDIAQAMKRVLTLTKLEYNKVVTKGLNQAKKFSWEEAARKTLQVLEKVANK